MRGRKPVGADSRRTRAQGSAEPVIPEVHSMCEGRKEGMVGLRSLSFTSILVALDLALKPAELPAH